ncbi:questin oxidase family protein [Chitinimonas naiadis]
MTSQVRNTALRQLLDANTGFSLDAVGTTNHLPMALVALAGMGATPQRLQDFFTLWERKYAIALAVADTTVTRNNWQGQIGNRAAFGALQALFTEWVGHEGANKVIAHVLRHIPAAPATGAFHALIRLSYGLRARHEGEVGAALAAMVVGNLPIALDLAGRPSAESVAVALTQLSHAQAGRTYGGESITGRLRAVAQDAVFDAALPAPPTTPSLLDEMARVAIALYWQTNNFTVLHMVTALHAARTVLPLLAPELAVRYADALWVAYCAAYVSVGAPALREASPARIEADWPDLMAAAVQDDDDHVIKMTYTCYQEYQREPNELYRQVAARLVGVPAPV